MKIDFKSFLKKKSKDKNNGFPYGSAVYVAHIGGGKTLSMVYDAKKIQEKFPKCKIYANFNIKGINNFKLVTNSKEMDEALADTNGGAGVLVLIDEAHLFWMKKDGIPVEVLSSISYQRKDNRRIMFSTQIWDELPVSTRKQVMCVVKCSRFLNLQINSVFDGHLLKYNKLTSQYEAPRSYTYIFKHNDELYNSYDTRQKAIKNSEFIEPLSRPIDNRSDELIRHVLNQNLKSTK